MYPKRMVWRSGNKSCYEGRLMFSHKKLKVMKRRKKGPRMIGREISPQPNNSLRRPGKSLRLWQRNSNLRQVLPMRGRKRRKTWRENLLLKIKLFPISAWPTSQKAMNSTFMPNFWGWSLRLIWDLAATQLWSISFSHKVASKRMFWACLWTFSETKRAKACMEPRMRLMMVRISSPLSTFLL